MPSTITFGNLPTFPADASTGQRLITLADLEDAFSGLTATVDFGSAIPNWVRVTKSYSDFSTAGLTNDIEVYSLPAGYAIHACVIKQSVAFAGGAISDYDISVGIVGTLAKYCAAHDVDSAVTATNFTSATTFGIESFTAATSIRGAATSVGANLNAATAGSVTFYLLVSKLIPDA